MGEFVRPGLRDLEHLTGAILRLGGRVEEMIHEAIQSLEERRPDLAREVIDADEAIDREEVRIEEECIRILALREPVAGDLRRVVSVLKIDADLERMADLAVNIAERTLALAECDGLSVPLPERFHPMTTLAVRMVRESLDAFVRSDAATARAVCALDDAVDRDNRAIIDELKAMIRADPGRIDAAFHLFSAVRQVERIADHATNIAEDVVYLREGAIIRHQPERGSA